MIDFNKLYRAGRVKRYHTADVPAQTLAQHSWGVVMIVAMIYPRGVGYIGVPSNLIMAALTHDLAESETGDIPATTKWGSARMSSVLDELEASFNQRYDIDYQLTPKELDILKWADTFELCLYCLHHVNMGNEYAGEILGNGLMHLRKKDFPTTEAKELYESIFR